MPAVVLSSDAARTQETWSTMADLMPASNVRITRGLYHAGVGAMMAELSGLDDTLPSSMILAHNPGCEDVVGWLSGQPTRMTTANAALLKGGGSSWLDALLPGTWTLEAVLRPKEL
jgi:phosphohistidine phosphatase